MQQGPGQNLSGEGEMAVDSSDYGGMPVSYPQRPGETECAYYMKTGTCKFGPKCKFHHPPDITPTWGAVTPATEFTVGLNKEQYPRRPGEQQCSFFLKTGTCKFKTTCKFDHPPEAVQYTQQYQGSFPIRPGEQQCAYYLKTGKCKFGATCRFDHPPLPAGAEMGGPMGMMGGPRGVPGSGGMVPPGPGGPYSLGGPPPNANGGPPLGMGPPPPMGTPLGYYPGPPVDGGMGMVMGGPPQGPGPHGQPLPGPYGPPQPGLPQRPGEKECTFFLKTGRCQYGPRCKFHHPVEKLPGNLAPVNVPPMGMAPLGPPMGPYGPGAPPQGMPLPAYAYQAQPPPGQMRDAGGADMGPLPQRPGQEACSYYMRTGRCSYGASCKFDHPRNRSAGGDSYGGGGMNGDGPSRYGGPGSQGPPMSGAHSGEMKGQPGPYSYQMNGSGGTGSPQQSGSAGGSSGGSSGPSGSGGGGGGGQGGAGGYAMQMNGPGAAYQQQYPPQAMYGSSSGYPNGDPHYGGGNPYGGGYPPYAAQGPGGMSGAPYQQQQQGQGYRP